MGRLYPNIEFYSALSYSTLYGRLNAANDNDCVEGKESPKDFPKLSSHEDTITQWNKDLFSKCCLSESDICIKIEAWLSIETADSQNLDSFM